MDTMALVWRFGKPDIFLTMTCNPNWNEIKRELYPDQTLQDYPNLVVHVFKAKLEELKDKLLKKGYPWKGPGACVCCGIPKEESTACIFFANHGQEIQDHMPIAV
jgi:hypothetical protein